MNPSRKDRAVGALMGLAVGDAIGTTVEFSPRGTFEPLTDMTGGGPFHLQPGQWTDDTSMALCIAESLIERLDFDAADQMRRYVRWWREGHLSSTGRCFDIGTATRASLTRFQRTANPMAGDTSPNSAGNGCLMRLAPVPIRYSHDPERAVVNAELSARTTHGAPECLEGTRIFAELLCRALNGDSKAQVLCEPTLTKPTGKYHAILIGQSYRKKPRNAIKGSGYVVDALEAALWAFDSTTNYADCVLAAANLGDDADTTAAIAGQLAGAFYGFWDIPAHWSDRVYDAAMIQSMAASLLDLQAMDTVDAAA